MNETVFFLNILFPKKVLTSESCAAVERERESSNSSNQFIKYIQFFCSFDERWSYYFYTLYRMGIAMNMHHMEANDKKSV